MSHEDERGPVFPCRVDIFKSGICCRRGRNCLRDCRLVLVDHGRVLADFAQKGLRNADGLKICRSGSDRFDEFIVLRAVHQVRGLDDQVLHAVSLRARKRLLDVVDHFLIACLHMVDDDLCRESPAHSPVRIGFLQRRLDPADIHRAALIEGSAEAHDQELILADLIRIPGIIQGSVAGIASEIIGIRELALYHFFLRVRQRVPRVSGRPDISVRRLRARLHINRVDLRGRVRCRFFIRHGRLSLGSFSLGRSRLGCFRFAHFRRGSLFRTRGFFRRRFLFCLLRSGSGASAAACQKRCCEGRCQ